MRWSTDLSSRFVPVLVVAFLAGVASCGEPDWTLLKPSNTGISGSYCEHIHVDSQDRAWIASYNPFWEEGGVSYHDGTKWVTISNVDYPVIASPRFNDIVVDEASDTMWIGTDLGLLRMKLSEGPDSLVRFDRPEVPLPGSWVTNLDLAPDRTLWIGMQELDGTASGGLVHYDPFADTWTVWTTHTPEPLPWGPSWPYWDWIDYLATTPDPDGGYTVWFGSFEMGMATLKDGEFTWYDPANPTETTYPRGLGSRNALDDAGNLWVITNRGLARRSPDGAYTIVGYPNGFTSEVAVVSALSGGRAVLGTYGAEAYLWDGGWTYLGNWGSGNHTSTFAEDSQGNIWAGGIGGASKYSNGQWQRYRVSNTGMLGYFIDAIAFAPNGDVYMDANGAPGIGGFDVYDGVNWTNANDFTYGLGLPWGLPTDDCGALYVRANGNLLVGTNGGQGVLEFDGQDYTYLTPSNYGCEAIVEDTLGRVWSARGYGVDLIDGSGDLTTFNAINSAVSIGQVSDVLVDRNNAGFVWAVGPFGVVHTDGVTFDVHPKENLDNIPSLVLCADLAPDGTLWIGTQEAMFHYDPVTRTSARYDTSNSVLPSDEFHTVTVAPDGTVWGSTFDNWFPYPGGISHFDGAGWTTYTETDSPLPLNQVWVTRARPIDNGYEVWIGTAGEAVAVITMTDPACACEFGGAPDSVDLLDLLAFLGLWFGADPAADVNADAQLTISDLLAFLDCWFPARAGVPCS